MTTTAVACTLQKGLPLLWRQHPHAAVGKWILGTAGLVVGMIHVGGITRLTQSGLSMTDWSVTGSLPPMTLEEWQKEFHRYQQFPEWQQRKHMTLSEFQYIYAWEYGHRMLGRVVGVCFIGPWLYFSWKGRIPNQPRMALLGSMGAAQGLVGWWMVQSGLGDDRRTDTHQIRVKPVRLATHLTMAVATYGALLWTGFELLSQPHTKETLQQLAKSLSKQALQQATRLRAGALALTGLTGLTIVSGALVAGNDAGRAYNTFPKMDGHWIPPELWELSPWTQNLVANTATVQWNHRVLGTATAATAAGLVLFGGPAAKAALTPQVRTGLHAVGWAVAGQFTLGVTTLLTYVPLSLAAAHQVGSIVVFTSGVYLVHALRYARPALVRASTTAPPPPQVVRSALKQVHA